MKKTAKKQEKKIRYSVNIHSIKRLRGCNLFLGPIDIRKIEIERETKCYYYPPNSIHKVPKPGEFYESIEEAEKAIHEAIDDVITLTSEYYNRRIERLKLKKIEERLLK